MIFRAATHADLVQLRALEQGVVEAERPFNPELRPAPVRYYDLEALIDSADSELLVVEVDREIQACGYAQIRPSKPSLRHERHAYLGFMIVAPALRGQGINAKVIERLLDWAKRRGVSDFYLDVYFENRAAVRAYEKMGFQPSLLEMKLSGR